MHSDHEKVNRREFVRDTAVMVAGVAMAGGLIDVQARIVPANAAEVPPAVKNTRNYNPNMEYRRLGKTGLWVSAVCMGGHWKRVDKVIGAQGKINPYAGPNRRRPTGRPSSGTAIEVVSRAWRWASISSISPAMRSRKPIARCSGRRDKMYLAYSHPASELRVPENRNAKKLRRPVRGRTEAVQAGVCRHLAADGPGTGRHAQPRRRRSDDRGPRHGPPQEGCAAFTGMSTHDRKWAKMPDREVSRLDADAVHAVHRRSPRCCRSTASSRAIIKHDVGLLGIKPFASNAIFHGDGSPDGPHAEEDNRRRPDDDPLHPRQSGHYGAHPRADQPAPGRQPGCAVRERRQLAGHEKAELDELGERMWAGLPDDYQWLKEWEYV